MKASIVSLVSVVALGVAMWVSQTGVSRAEEEAAQAAAKQAPPTATLSAVICHAGTESVMELSKTVGKLNNQLKTISQSGKGPYGMKPPFKVSAPGTVSMLDSHSKLRWIEVCVTVTGTAPGN
jgi:hypothetical protein